jgi:hypothetical protein
VKFPRAMAPLRQLACTALALAWVPAAWAHSDPLGDIHPQVLVVDGNFAIDFNAQIPGEENHAVSESLVRVTYTSDGKLLAPRHRLERKRSHTEMGSAGIYGTTVRFGDSELIFDWDRSAMPGYLIKAPDGKLTPVRLPWPEKTTLSYVDDFTATPEGIAISGKEDRHRLKVYWFPFASTGPPAALDLGVTCCIYDFPVASNLTWAGGKFWLAFMRGEGKGEEARVKLVLWSWKPGYPAGKEEVLDSPGHWNSHLSLGAIGKQLCLAYHCEQLHGEEQRASIITIFRTAE